MLLLVLTIIVCLGGVLLSNVVGGISLDSLTQGPIVAAVTGAFIALYLASYHGTRRDGGSKLAPVLGLVVIAALGLACLRDSGTAAISGFLASLPQGQVALPFQADAPASVRIRRNSEGSFRAHADVNGSDVAMLVDTGSAAVVLRGTDAETAGIETKGLVYDIPLATANGTTYVGAVRIKSLRVGKLTARDVEAFVAKPGTLNESLLGMTFLRRLASYEVAGDFVTLRQ